MPAVSVKKPVKVQVPVPVPEKFKRGMLLSLLSIPVGIAAWVVLWNLGSMASLVPFATAWLAAYLYTLGAKAPVSRRAAPFVLAVIIVGVVLAFIAGMASDAVEYFVENTTLDVAGALLTIDFWSFFGDNLFNNADLWASYLTAIVIAVVFTVMGYVTTVRVLFERSGDGAKVGQSR